jgi:ABC-type branched-subunit amino acid transport system substrate-binding protein
MQQAAAFAACSAGQAGSQPGKKPSASQSSGAPVAIAQIVDVSQAQQDVSRDFLTGSRAAWQDINQRGGLGGRPVQHLTIETDGTPQSLRSSLDAVKNNTSCVAIFGSAGDHAASQIVDMLRMEGSKIAHVAPWLQNSSLEIDENTFPIFAARQEQISFALKSLAVMGVGDLGAIYASTREYDIYNPEIQRITSALQLKLRAFQGRGELRVLGQQLTPSTPAVLLFVGGTPELAAFTQGMEKQSRQRYIVALADVNLQTLLLMGAARVTPVIATQPVPPVNSSVPIVRSYREILGRLFDEPPTALSLAGFLAARYTHRVLGEVDGSMSRASVLAEFQRRSKVDLGGFDVNFNASRRSAGYVTQSMMAMDGRLIG